MKLRECKKGTRVLTPGDVVAVIVGRHTPKKGNPQVRIEYQKAPFKGHAHWIDPGFLTPFGKRDA